ncbi:MAG TPA: lasso peptide biosynthesis B2 protein [Novosphingobium sp.]|nr:lasso peptide biosynthesis B2 protein [Novosphingobium sp.]HQA17181.1 lasso peptide biosynthesis B2 protein [Novosphingobium sp.]
MSLRAETWRLRLRTAEALADLAMARAAIALAPFRRWDGWLGLAGPGPEPDAVREAHRLARHVDRAAQRLPFEIKCLPRAMALSRMLRRRGVPHRLVLAVRPADLRGGNDDLHAWIEVEKTIVIGDLPGPWTAVFSFPQAQK